MTVRILNCMASKNVSVSNDTLKVKVTNFLRMYIDYLVIHFNMIVLTAKCL